MQIGCPRKSLSFQLCHKLILSGHDCLTIGCYVQIISKKEGKGKGKKGCQLTLSLFYWENMSFLQVLWLISLSISLARKGQVATLSSSTDKGRKDLTTEHDAVLNKMRILVIRKKGCLGNY